MTTHPFIADIVGLRHHPGRRERLAARAVLEGLAVTDSRVPSGGAVELDVTLEAVDGAIVVSGTVTAPWEGECRRCLGPVVGGLEVTLEELFVEEPEEGEAYPVEGERIDLEPLAREAVVLALPLAPLCRPDCAGLCEVCGADRNAGPCGCDPPPGDPRWAALDVLRESP